MRLRFHEEASRQEDTSAEEQTNTEADFDAIVQRLDAKQRHGQKRHAAILADRMDGDDVLAIRHVWTSRGGKRGDFDRFILAETDPLHQRRREESVRFQR